MISFLIMIMIYFFNEVFLPILFKLIILAFKLLIPTMKALLLNYLIPYLERRVENSFLNHTSLSPINNLLDFNRNYKNDL